MNKEQLFIDWLCGKSNYFPFFKTRMKAPMPIREKDEAGEQVYFCMECQGRVDREDYVFAHKMCVDCFDFIQSLK